MSESGLFLCKSCEQFFQAELGEREERRCLKCDSSVLGSRYSSKNISEVDEVESPPAQNITQLEPVDLEAQGDVAEPLQKRKKQRKTKKRIRGDAEQRGEGRKVGVTKRRRKMNYGKYFFFILVWALSLGAITYHLRSDRFSSMEEVDSEVAVEKRRLAQVDAGRRKYVNDEISKCYTTLLMFLNTVDSVERTLHVKDANRVGPLMTNYYRNLHERVVPSGQLNYLRANLLDVEGDVAIESIWQDQKGRRLEAIFFRAPGEKWLLDWEHFVKSSSQAFLTFLTDPDESEGQFRVLIRERKSPEISARGVRSYSVYPPKILGETSVEIDQAEFEISVDSPLVKELDAYADSLKNENYVFASRFQKEEIPSLIRMNLRLKLTHTEEGDKILTLVEILNSHWLGVESQGYE